MLTIVSTRLKISAARKPSTLKPGTIADVSMISIALITNVKSPSVMTLTGSVRMTMIGLMNALTAPSTTAATSAEKTPTVTPGTMNAEIPIAKAEIIQWMMVVIYFKLILIV